MLAVGADPMKHYLPGWITIGIVGAVGGLYVLYLAYRQRLTHQGDQGNTEGHTLVGWVCRHRPRSSLSVTRFSNVSYARRPGLGLGKSSLLRCALAADGVHPSCKASCCDDSCGSAMHKRFNNLSRAGVHLVCSMVGRSNLLI